jgi:hydroxymethylglutaryl-CoA reductase (NADPH)
VFFILFFSVVCFLLTRWREKICNSTSLDVFDLAKIFALVASFIYLLSFFQSIFCPSTDVWATTDDKNNAEDVIL